MENHKHRMTCDFHQRYVQYYPLQEGMGRGGGRVQMWGLEGLKRYSPKELFEQY